MMSISLQLHDWILFDILGYTVDVPSSYMLQPLALLLTYIAIAVLIVIMFKLAIWSVKYITGFIPW